jgi:hypothetical protein
MIFHQLRLVALSDLFAVCKLHADAPVPAWCTATGFFSISRSGEELSVVCRQDAVPEGIKCERGWRCLRVAGSIDFAVVGVLASLVAPLAKAGISVFAISTFDTDYLLVEALDFDRAVGALQKAGHSFQVWSPI